MNKFIGAHVSISGGIYHALIRANKLNATAIAFFIKNQLQWKTISLRPKIINKFKSYRKILGYKTNQIIVHGSYLINLGHPDKKKIEKSRIALIDEINCCEKLNINLINIHPGNHLYQITENECIIRIANSINLVLEKTNNVSIVIENSAGQGSSIGYRFEHLSNIINLIEDKSRIGVCIDTCHTFASGYDIRTKSTYDSTFKLFDDIVGFHYLRALHVNDSKNKCGSLIDRHHNLTNGNIGKLAFTLFMNDKRFDNIPIILETKNYDILSREIYWLKSLIKNNNH